MKLHSFFIVAALAFSANAQNFVQGSSAFGLQGNCYSVSFADIDDDGDQDAFVSCNAVSFYRNTGTKTSPAFLMESTNLGIQQAFDIAFADLDNDGDFDALVTVGVDPYIYNNTGTKETPSFVHASILTGLGGCTGIDMADIDNDGDYDAVGASTPNKFYINTGTSVTAGFATSLSDLGFNQHSSGADLVDFNGDGVTDLVSAYADGIKFWRNNGTKTEPHFEVMLGNYGITASGFGIHFVDIDSDGDKDAFVAYGSTGISYWQNTSPAGVNESLYSHCNVLSTPRGIEVRSDVPVRDAEMIIYDVTGREMLKTGPLTGNEFLVSTDHLTTGVYFYRLTEMRSGITQGKLVVQ